MPPGCLDAVKQRCRSLSLSADPKCTVYRTRYRYRYRTVFFLRVQICQNVANFVKGTYTGIYDAVFRIRIQIRSGFRGPLDPDPDSDSMNMDPKHWYDDTCSGWSSWSWSWTVTGTTAWTSSGTGPSLTATSPSKKWCGAAQPPLPPHPPPPSPLPPHPPPSTSLLPK